MIPQRGRTFSILALATAGCLWGTGFYFGKTALSEMPVATMVLFRFAFACVGLLPFMFFDRPRFGGSEWGWVLAAAVLGVPVQYLVQIKGFSLTTVSHASLMVGTLPMLLAIAAVLFSGERLHLGGWLALAASTVGAVLIALSSKGASGTAHASIRGDSLVVLSMFAAIAWILISKRLMREHSPVMVTGFVYWLGTLLLVAVVVTTSGIPSLHYSHRVWVAVAEQGLLATASTTLSPARFGNSAAYSRPQRPGYAAIAAGSLRCCGGGKSLPRGGKIVPGDHGGSPSGAWPGAS